MTALQYKHTTVLQEMGQSSLTSVHVKQVSVRSLVIIQKRELVPSPSYTWRKFKKAVRSQKLLLDALCDHNGTDATMTIVTLPRVRTSPKGGDTLENKSCVQTQDQF